MIILLIIGIIIIFIVFQGIFVALTGSPVAKPTVPRETQLLGNKEPHVSYVVIGDSTSVGQGTSYDNSIAWLSAKHLSETYQVRLTNLGVSGATVASVLNEQAVAAAKLRPDIMLVAVGANDVRRLTSITEIEHNLRKLIATLRKHNPNVFIAFTGAPDMGSVPRFSWFVRLVATQRTKKVNAAIQQITNGINCVRIPIAEETGPIFRKDPRLFALDKFHPTKEGYRVWMPPIERVLDTWHPEH